MFFSCLVEGILLSSSEWEARGVTEHPINAHSTVLQQELSSSNWSNSDPKAVETGSSCRLGKDDKDSGWSSVQSSLDLMSLEYMLSLPPSALSCLWEWEDCVLTQQSLVP